jgi:hypothetical protein
VHVKKAALTRYDIGSALIPDCSHTAGPHRTATFFKHLFILAVLQTTMRQNSGQDDEVLRNDIAREFLTDSSTPSYV